MPHVLFDCGRGLSNEHAAACRPNVSPCRGSGRARFDHFLSDFQIRYTRSRRSLRCPRRSQTASESWLHPLRHGHTNAHGTRGPKPRPGLVGLPPCPEKGHRHRKMRLIHRRPSEIATPAGNQPICESRISTAHSQRRIGQRVMASSGARRGPLSHFSHRHHPVLRWRPVMATISFHTSAICFSLSRSRSSRSLCHSELLDVPREQIPLRVHLRDLGLPALDQSAHSWTAP